MDTKRNLKRFSIGLLALIIIMILIISKLFLQKNNLNENIDYNIRKNIDIITNREKYINGESIVIGNNLKELENRIL